jgi:hypothetical protein
MNSSKHYHIHFHLCKGAQGRSEIREILSENLRLSMLIKGMAIFSVSPLGEKEKRLIPYAERVDRDFLASSHGFGEVLSSGKSLANLFARAYS